jgi:hypothetical protein
LNESSLLTSRRWDKQETCILSGLKRWPGSRAGHDISIQRGGHIWPRQWQFLLGGKIHFSKKKFGVFAELELRLKRRAEKPGSGNQNYKRKAGL